MSIELKVKAKSLAAESRIIRKEEQKFLAFSRTGNVKFLKKRLVRKYGREWEQHFPEALAEFNERNDVIKTRLGDNWQAELTARRRKALTGFTSLREHRIHHVRPVARATHLARAYIAGKPYKSVEASCKTSPGVEAVRKMVAKYSHLNSSDALDSWFKA